MAINLPLFVRAKDSGEVTAYSSVAEAQNRFERIDVENDEYEAWDSDGLPLSLAVGRQAGWLRIEPLGTAPQPAELSDAIRRFAKDSEVHVDLLGLERNEFRAVLENVRIAIDRKWRTKSWWQRFKARF